MKFQKLNKGWILEELEKKHECLDPKEFGGEDPEEVEKEREERAKNIKKSFKETEENGEKVKGKDEVVFAKTTKVEEDFKTRKELAKLLESLKAENTPYKISKSTKEEFRWHVSYEKIEESRGGFVKKYRGYRIIETPEVFVITDPHGTTVGESKTIPGCEGIIDELIGKPVEESFEKIELDEDASEDIKVEKDGKELIIKKTNRMSPDEKFDVWCDNHHCGMFNSVEDAKAYIENEFSKECCEESLKEEKHLYHCDRCGKEIDQDKTHWFNGAEYGLCDDCYDKLSSDEEEKLDRGIYEDLPDAIPEEPIVISTEPEVEEEVVENGIYMALSSELRDTLSDIENLKSLTVTIANEAGEEDLINELNSIIDDRTIHVGMLQTLMDKFDSKVEPEEEKDFDERKEEINPLDVIPQEEQEALAKGELIED